MISIIVAATRNRMIGENNDFPWQLSADLKRFRERTTGHTIIMGRGTYDHLLQRVGRMLPNRTSVVITRNKMFEALPGVIVAHSLEDALENTKGQDEVFIIGGAQLYAYALPFADRIYLTEIDATIDGDAFFPEINPDEWQETMREFHGADEKNDYDFSWVTLDKKAHER